MRGSIDTRSLTPTVVFLVPGSAPFLQLASLNLR